MKKVLVSHLFLILLAMPAVAADWSVNPGDGSQPPVDDLFDWYKNRPDVGPPDHDKSAPAIPTKCGPIFERYPIAGPHNQGWDNYWWSWTCGTANSNSDYRNWGDDPHYGLDLWGARGTPIVAAQSGTLGSEFWNGTGGNVVYIVDDCGYTHYYAHLDSIDPALAGWVGSRILAGTRLGTLGNTGNAAVTQPHLHYSTYAGNYYSGSVNPHSALQGVESTSCTSGNACSCLQGINVKGYSVPVTDTACGFRVCGVSNELWECKWNSSGGYWDRVGGVGSCNQWATCNDGRYKNGRRIPGHMTHVGFRVCGMTNTFWECRSGNSWHNTQLPCS
ncbi:MAG: M23 family metallopeptidase [Acidobacteriota bacterium]